MGCHFLLQGIFATQGSNLDLLLGMQILYHLSHQGSPLILCYVMLCYIILYYIGFLGIKPSKFMQISYAEWQQHWSWVAAAPLNRPAALPFFSILTRHVPFSCFNLSGPWVYFSHLLLFIHIQGLAMYVWSEGCIFLRIAHIYAVEVLYLGCTTTLFPFLTRHAGGNIYSPNIRI